MKKAIMKIAQNQMGSAHLEADSPKRLIRSFFNKVLQVCASTSLPIGAKNRCRLERLRGVKIGKHVFLAGGNILDRVRPDLITIEDYVSLAGNVTILTHSNPTTPLREILGPKSAIISPVIIKRGAWVTINCVILPGVTIGECAIVATGSVVTKDVPPYCLVGGSPAKLLKNFDPALRESKEN